MRKDALSFKLAVPLGEVVQARHLSLLFNRELIVRRFLAYARPGLALGVGRCRRRRGAAVSAKHGRPRVSVGEVLARGLSRLVSIPVCGDGAAHLPPVPWRDRGRFGVLRFELV